MVKNEIIVSSVVSRGLGVRATAKKYGVSPAWVSTLSTHIRHCVQKFFDVADGIADDMPLQTTRGVIEAECVDG